MSKKVVFFPEVTLEDLRRPLNRGQKEEYSVYYGKTDPYKYEYKWRLPRIKYEGFRNLPI